VIARSSWLLVNPLILRLAAKYGKVPADFTFLLCSCATQRVSLGCGVELSAAGRSSLAAKLVLDNLGLTAILVSQRVRVGYRVVGDKRLITRSQLRKYRLTLIPELRGKGKCGLQTITCEEQ